MINLLTSRAVASDHTYFINYKEIQALQNFIFSYVIDREDATALLSFGKKVAKWYLKKLINGVID